MALSAPTSSEVAWPHVARTACRLLAGTGVFTLAFAALNGCALDSRQLSAAGGQAGSESTPLPGAGAGTAGAAGTSSEQAGSAGGGQLPLVDGCPDLDSDGVSDCMQTLVQNGEFKLGIAGWSPELQTEIAWDDMNAAADLPSGSALVSSIASSSSERHYAKQCLALSGTHLVTVYANAFVASGQAAGGYAEVDLSFFDTAACAGSEASKFSTPQPLDASTDEWLTLKAGSVSGPDTQSVLVALTIYRPLGSSSFSARFDNILLRKQTPSD